MEKEMITIVTDMQLSMERLEKIFSVPKTKELYEKLIKQESNEEKIKELATRLEKIFDVDDSIITPIEAVKHRIKCCILADSIEGVVNGKSLNQAIQAEIRKQLEKANAIKKAEENVTKLELHCEMRDIWKEAIKSYFKDLKN